MLCKSALFFYKLFLNCLYFYYELKFFKMKTKSIFSLVAVFLFGIGVSFSQSYTVSGKQEKGVAGVNAKLDCKPLKITKTVTIKEIIGDNNGFWISDGRNVIAKFWSTNDKAAIGFVLKPGTYYVYPNLKINSSNATVTLKLE